jgi:RNA polymerase sigma-70 factor (ECF subfamily)
MEFTAESFMTACRERGARLEQWLKAFDRLHGASLYREAALRLGSWQVAQDVVQDGMIKVWMRCATFRGDAQPLTWVKRIVRNTLLDHLEQNRPDDPLVDDEGELTPEAERAITELSRAAVATPEASLRESQVAQVYKACFAQFARDCPAHAQVLRWVVDEGMSNAELEVLLERTPGATREFISQARKKARIYLKPWYDLVRPDPSAAARPSSSGDAP